MVLGLAGALVGVVPDGVSAVPARSRCRQTALVTNRGSDTVSLIDVRTRTKNPEDIKVGVGPAGVAVTPDGQTGVISNSFAGTVSTIDMRTRTKSPADITVGLTPAGVAITPDGKTAFVANGNSGTVSTIDMKTRRKNLADIPVGAGPVGVAITPDGKTAFVANSTGGTVSTIDVKTRRKNPTDIPVGAVSYAVAVTPDAGTIAHRSWRAPGGIVARSPTMQSVSVAPAPTVTSSHSAVRSTDASFPITTRAPCARRSPSIAASSIDVSRQSRGVPMSRNEA